MGCRPWLGALILICLFLVSEGRELKIKDEDYTHIYNHTLAKRLAEYASAVYMSDLTALFTWTCSRCKDMTTGFEVIELVVDVQNCLQAFVGVDHDLNSTIIAFRGTQDNSIQNWIEDLFWKQLDLNYPDMPDAMVHHGFYFAYHNTTIRPGILSAVRRTQELYSYLPIMVTGHSMGGAMASFCALDLIVWLHNFGFGSLVYMIEKICDGSGEDPSCSRSVSGNSISDHLAYYGIRLSADSWSSCSIIMDKNLMQYHMDTAGNIVMSRYPAMLSFIKPVSRNNTLSSSI